MNLGSIKDKSNKQKRKTARITTVATLASLAVIAGVATFSLLTPKEQEFSAQISPTATPKAEQSVQAPGEVNESSLPDDDAQVSQDTVVIQKMLLPVQEASVLKGYASDTLVYSNTLKHWETHTGIDLSAKEGASVLAALDGEIITIENDSLMGNTVIILHDNGFKTVYSSLASISEDIAVGTHVLRGAEIGFVGATAAAESSDGAHLHFEVYLNDAPVNPQTYLSGLIK